jgi:hypothetical protein
MKKIISPLSNGGFPWTNEDLVNFQDVETLETSQLFNSFGSAYVLTGCNVISQDSGAGTCELSSGWVWLNDALRFVEEYSGPYPFYITPSADIVTTRTFQDGTVHPAYREKTTAVTTTVPGSGQYLAFIPTCSDLLDTITADLEAALAAEVTARTNAVTSLTAADTTLTAAVATKALRYTANIAPTALPLASFASPYGLGSTPPAYMRDETGRVYLEGSISIDIAGSGGDNVIATLPAGCRPTRGVIDFNRPVVIPISTGTLHQLYLQVMENGNVQYSVYPTPGASDFIFTSLNGLSFSTL